MQNTLDEIAARLRECSRVAVFSHYNPDIDAYGSSCGLTLALQGAGIDAVCINETGVLDRYRAFPGVAEVRSELPEGSFDGAVVCDCGDIGRVGERMRPHLSSFPFVVNIDHHSSNDHFGTMNYVKVEASSTSEIIVELVRALKVPFSAEIATCLFAGIVGDTGSFRYASTSARTFEVAEELVRAGAVPSRIAHELFSRDQISAVRLQAEALLSLELFFDGRLAQIVVHPEMYARHQATPEDTDALAERARDIEGVVVSLLVRRHDDVWRVSMRSKSSLVDLSAVARTFGGGGHKAAAAFRWRRELSELLPLVRGEIGNALGDVRC